MANQTALIDANGIRSLLLESSSVPGQTVRAQGDQTTGRLLTDNAGGGTGTVTSVSVVTANGFAGSVATATTTPAITVSTTVTGLLSGNGTAVSAASTIGSGAVVLATSPTLVTPALGTPTALVGTNITGTAASLTAGTVTTNANLTGAVTSSGNATSLGSFSSANLLAAITDETGTGKAVFATKPTFIGTVQTVTAMGAQAVDGSTGNVFTRTLAGSEVFTQSNFTTGQFFIVEVTQGSGTSYTVTWFAGVTWVTSGATAPVQTTTSSGITTYGFRCTGSNTFLGYLVGTQ